MQGLLDRFWPGSIKDLIIVICVIGAAIYLYSLFGDIGLLSLIGLGAQGSNKKQKADAAKAEAERHSQLSKEYVEEAKRNAEAASRHLEEIERVASEEATDTGRTNEERVNDIRRNGGL